MQSKNSDALEFVEMDGFRFLIRLSRGVYRLMDRLRLRNDFVSLAIMKICFQNFVHAYTPDYTYLKHIIHFF
jgi:hypothetical protein